ncbi:YdcF family protein [Arsukibacterium sp.]|uniref:YdcF family protein n=1 Tax=Arsukibacterium sp. TaxID=1977258 RepID=UPI002FD98F24
MDVLKTLLLPLPILMLLLAISLWFCWREKPGARWLTSMSILLLWLASISPVSDRLAAPLELKHPAYRQAAAVDNIMVLGCRHQSYPHLPLSSQLELCSLARLQAAVAIWHQHPSSRLWLSGEISGQQSAHTDIMRQVAVSLGVKPEQISTLAQVYNTQQEAAALAPLIVDQRNVLVTSAMHMPRAYAWFGYYGAQVQAAPTHFQIRYPLAQFTASRLLPNPSALQTLHYAWYEHLAIAQQRLAIWWDAENP